MNKKKACIDSLSGQQDFGQEPAHKLPRLDNRILLSASAGEADLRVDSQCSNSNASDTDHKVDDHIHGSNVPDSGRNVDQTFPNQETDCKIDDRFPRNSNLSENDGKVNSQFSSLSGSGNVQSESTPSVPVPAAARLGQLSSDQVTCGAEDKKLQYLNKEIFLNQDLIQQFSQAFHSESDFVDASTGVALACRPFRHCILPELITRQDYVKDLQSALLDLPLRDKNNDLYKFSQSRDLNHSKSSTISTFRTLCNGIKSALSAMTGIPLSSRVDLFCSQYKYTDALLCHDDELEGRRVAFIYYLVPDNWAAVDGGALDLFSCDNHGQPASVVKSIVPRRNSFVFFEVSPVSFHQVAEVLSEDKTRLSLTGWFHGPPISRPEPYITPLPPALPYGSIEEEVFYAWFNPLYLAPEVQRDIRKRFEEDSEIELTDFLQEAKYTELVTALNSSSISWSWKGPPNKRQYPAADKSSLPPVVTEFLRVMHSDAVFLVLSNLTGLKLHSLAPPLEDEPPVNGSCTNGDGHNPRCRSEIRKWEHGCYTLAHDTDPEVFDFALDSMLYIDCGKNWSFDLGGQTSYIAKGEEEELLSVTPCGNSLALVYRDKDTLRFVKHLNHRTSRLSPPRFFEVNTVYYE